MKSRGLLSVLSFSEKRESILFFLFNGPRTLADIKNQLNVTSPEILPRIKEMETNNLICKENKKYILTPIGNVVVKLFQPLVNTLHVIDENKKFWERHIVEAIPQHLLERIGELGNCKLIENRTENIYEPHSLFLESLSKSKKIMGISPVLHPLYPQFFLQLAESGKNVSLILTGEVFGRIKSEHTDMLQKFLTMRNAQLFVSDEDIRLACGVTECFFSISLFFNNGNYDSQKDLVSFDNSAIKWGEELFDDFLNNSKEIKNL